MHLSPLLSQIPVNWGKGKGKKAWPNKDGERDKKKTDLLENRKKMDKELLT